MKKTLAIAVAFAALALAMGMLAGCSGGGAAASNSAASAPAPEKKISAVIDQDNEGEYGVRTILNPDDLTSRIEFVAFRFPAGDYTVSNENAKGTVLIRVYKNEPATNAKGVQEQVQADFKPYSLFAGKSIDVTLGDDEYLYVGPKNPNGVDPVPVRVTQK